MRRSSFTTRLLVAAASVGLLVIVAGPATAGAALRAPGAYICTGKLKPGAYPSILVRGFCLGPARGTVLVGGSVIVGPGASLIANYPAAPKQHVPEGDATWKIAGAVVLKRNATLTLGCEPHFGCKNTTSDFVGGGLTATGALGVIVHATAVNGAVKVSGGGGGLSCKPSGVFKMFAEPVYSDFEDDTIRGNLAVSSLTSCWLGLARDAVDGSVTIGNDKLADPDAIEILSNAIVGNLACSGNSQVWDSTEAQFGQKTLYPRIAEPNAVVGMRSGQCVLASPATQGGQPGPGAF